MSSFQFSLLFVLVVALGTLLPPCTCRSTDGNTNNLFNYNERDGSVTYKTNVQLQQEQEQRDQRFPPIKTNPKLDCGMRCLFWEKAQAALPWRKDHQDIREALGLDNDQDCQCDGSDGSGGGGEDNENGEDASAFFLGRKTGREASRTSSMEQRKGRRARLRQQDHNKDKKNKHASSHSTHSDNKHKYSNVMYVCPKQGQDHSARSGNETHPFQTIQYAVERTRHWKKKLVWNQNTTHMMKIVLQAGIHFLKQTLVLTPDDRHLLLEGREGAWISGGVSIPKDAAGWHPTTSSNKTIWVADHLASLLPAQRSNSFLSGLFTVDPHTRLTLARYPNANVEEWNAPNRYKDSIGDKDASRWLFLPLADVPNFDFMNLTDPNNPTGHTKMDSSMEDYNYFGIGQGGACTTVWGDIPSYWCSNVSAGGWAGVDKAAAQAGRMNVPAGMVLVNTTTPGSLEFQQRVQTLWKKHSVEGAIFHVSHTQGWAWHMFNVSHIVEDANNKTTIHFDKGGWQGGRNWQCMDKDRHLSDCNGDDKYLWGGPWYVEGVLPELDAPGEFYWDKTTQKLYLYPDCGGDDSSSSSTCAPPDLIGTNLQTFIKFEGTQQNPVSNIQLKGLRFRDAAKTYMEQWGAPSGGDWALHRGGAIHLEGTENIDISDCVFRRLDGNAILLGGYNRHTTVTRSDFSWLGEGAMATWGDTANGYDATGGAQPRLSRIENNVMSNLGLYQKQSSAWGQNKACQNVIRNNVMFNLPRAAINFNDGLGGGNLVEGNIIFHACRESGDHGPINSWDRMPFLADTTGTPSFAALPTHTQHNLIWADHGASQGFDNDDGSSFYYTHDNVFYQSDGFKMDFGGHSSRFYNNLVYADGHKSCYGTGSFLEGQADNFENNTCIVARKGGGGGGGSSVSSSDSDASPGLGHLFQCSLSGMKPANNRYYTDTGNGTFACGNQNDLSLQDMQKQGFEVGSNLNVIPSEDTILQWARDILAL